ncbi:MAG: hypothetical protein AVDCRST_MAG06-2227, partial [uncultured Nocardioides sp.]
EAHTISQGTGPGRGLRGHDDRCRGGHARGRGRAGPRSTGLGQDLEEEAPGQGRPALLHQDPVRHEIRRQGWLVHQAGVRREVLLEDRRRRQVPGEAEDLPGHLPRGIALHGGGGLRVRRPVLRRHAGGGAHRPLHPGGCRSAARLLRHGRGPQRRPRSPVRVRVAGAQRRRHPLRDEPGVRREHRDADRGLVVLHHGGRGLRLLRRHLGHAARGRRHRRREGRRARGRAHRGAAARPL